MEPLRLLDVELYEFINSNGLPALDPFMLLLSSEWVWIVGFGVAAMWFGWKRNKRVLTVIAIAMAAIIFTDAVTARLMKPFFGRSRPCYVIQTRLVPSSCGSERSFPSNHAANAMAAATVVSLYAPMWGPLAALVAFAVGISRVYLGVHYPFDVLGGFIAGMICGALVYTAATQRLWKKRS